MISYGSFELRKSVENINSPREMLFCDLFSFAQDWVDAFEKDPDAECYSIDGVSGLEFYTSPRLAELKNAVQSIAQEWLKAADTVLWVDAIFDIYMQKDRAKYEAYQKLNWVLEEIYSTLRAMPGLVKCSLGMIPINSLGMEASLEAFYQEKLEELKAAAAGESYEKIGWFDVDISLCENVLKAEIKCRNATIAEAAQYYFYLVKDSKVIDKQGWFTDNCYQWTLEEDGIYHVQGFVRNSYDKGYRKSTARGYFSEESQAEFDSFLAHHQKVDTPHKADLAFRKSVRPFADFLIISSKVETAAQAAADSFMEKCKAFPVAAHKKIGHYNTFVLATDEMKECKDGSSLFFSGTMTLDEKIVIGRNDLPDTVSTDDLDSAYGNYCFVNITDDEIRLGADLFNFSHWYYHETEDTMVISNSYHALLLCLKNMGAEISLDADKAAVMLSTVRVQFLHQNFTRKMDIKGVEQLGLDYTFCLSESGWAREQSLCGIILRQDDVFHESKYRALLGCAANEIIGNVAQVAEDDRFEYVKTDLTGGLDSRMVYAAATNIDSIKKKAKIASYAVAGSDDLPIATEINSIYGFDYDDVPEEKKYLSISVADQIVRSYYLGTYFSYLPFTQISVASESISLNGACGEIVARPYIARKYLGTMAEDAGSEDQFTDYIWSDFSGELAAADEKTQQDFRKYLADELRALPVSNVLESYDKLYLYYRNLYHFSNALQWQLGLFSWMPLQSKTAFRLNRMTFSQFKSIKLQLDYIATLNPLLASIRFDSPKDEENAQRLRSSLAVDDQRFKGICVSGKDDMERWEAARKKKWESRKTMNVASLDTGKVLDEYEHQHEYVYSALLNNFQELMVRCPALKNRVGTALYCYIKAHKEDRRIVQYYYNKVTSLLDQVSILSCDDIEKLAVENEVPVNFVNEVSCERAENDQEASKQAQSKGITDSFLANEKVMEGRFPIRYVLQEVPGAEWLVIIFSAFATENHPVQHPYNFTNAIDTIPAHKLFIQDSCGRHGTYYLCDHMDFGVEESVSALIRSVQQSLQCSDERTVSLGSSKGGSAAAYFALKHGFAHGLAMVPQLRIGTYISSGASKRETLEDMLGQDVTEQNLAMLDSLLLNAVRKNDRTKLHILTSENDEQYPEQILPFLDDLKAAGHEIVVENRIVGHNQAAAYNIDFVHSMLRQCVFGAFFRQEDGFLHLWLGSDSPKNLLMEYVWETAKGEIQKVVINETEQVLSLENILWGEFSVQDVGKEIYRRYYCPWVTDSFCASCSQTKTVWEIEFAPTVNTGPEFHHAFYILDGSNRKIHVQNYTNEAKFIVPKNEMSGQTVQFFWKYKNWAFTRTGAVGKELIDISDLVYDMTIENGMLRFEIRNEIEHEAAQFGYYVKCNGVIIFKQNYNYSKYFQYAVTEAGRYSVCYFLKQGERREYRESYAMEYSGEA